MREKMINTCSLLIKLIKFTFIFSHFSSFVTRQAASSLKAICFYCFGILVKFADAQKLGTAVSLYLDFTRNKSRNNFIDSFNHAVASSTNKITDLSSNYFVLLFTKCNFSRESVKTTLRRRRRRKIHICICIHSSSVCCLCKCRKRFVIWYANSILNAWIILFISAVITVRGEKKNETPQRFFCIIGVFYVLAKVTSYMSLRYVPYPTSVVGKCKQIYDKL